MNNDSQVSMLRKRHVLVLLPVLVSFFLTGFVWNPSLITQIIILVIAIGSVGLAHGAMDHRVAEILFRSCLGGKWYIVFGLFYISLAGLFLGFWLFAPAAALTIFIIYSAVHFGSGEQKSRGLMFALARGSLPLLLPMAIHPIETSKIFGWLAGTQIDLLANSVPIAFACVACGVITLASSVRDRSIVNAGQTILVVLVNITNPPLISFTIYFVLIHSVRHLIELANWLEPLDVRRGLWRIARESIPLTVLTVVSMTAALFMFEFDNVEVGVIRVVFMTLSVLTVPHMILTAWAERSIVSQSTVDA